MGWHHVYARGACPADSFLVRDSWREVAAGAPADLPRGLLLTLDEPKNAKQLRPIPVEVPTAPVGRTHLCAVQRLRHLFGLQRRYCEPEQQAVFCSYAAVNPPREALTAAGFANRFERLATAALP